MRHAQTQMGRISPMILALAPIASLAISSRANAAPPAQTRGQIEATASQKKSASDLVKSADTKIKDGDARGALADLEAALAVPPKLQAEIDAIKKRIDDVRKTPSHIHIETSPPGATISIDGKALTQWAPVDVAVAPGRHVIHVTAPDRAPQYREVDVEFATDIGVSFVLAAPPPIEIAPEPTPPPPSDVAPAPPSSPPPPPEPPPSPHEASRMTAQYVLAGASVVGFGLGTAFGAVALNDKSSFDKSPTRATGQEGNDFAVYADAAFAVGAASLITGLVLFFTDDSRNAQNASTRTKASKNRPFVSPIVSPRGAGAGAIFQF